MGNDRTRDGRWARLGGKRLSGGFGDRLRRLRLDAGLRQVDLASRLHIPRGTLAHYEIGKRMPTYETLQALADYFSVSTDYLLGRADAVTEPGTAYGPGAGGQDDSAWPEGLALIRRAALTLSPEEKRKLLRLIKVAAFPDYPDGGGDPGTP